MADGQIISGTVVAGAIETSSDSAVICSWSPPENTTVRIEAFCIIQDAEDTNYKKSYTVIATIKRASDSVTIESGPTVINTVGNNVEMDVTLVASDQSVIAITENAAIACRVLCFMNMYGVESDFTPFFLSSLNFWADPTDENDLTFATQPTGYVTGWETGTTESWLAYSTGSVAVSTALPYSGSYALRCTGAGSSFGAQKGGLTNGNRYHVKLHLRGSTNLSIYVGTSSGGFICPIDTNWQTFEGEFEVPASTNFLIFEQSGAIAGTWFEIDDIEIAENISITTVTPKLGDDITNGTAANQPWQDTTTGWVRFDGGTDYLASSVAASTFKFMNDGTGASGFIAFSLDSLDAERYLLDTSGITSITNDGFGVFLDENQRAGIVLRNSTTGIDEILAYLPNGSITPGGKYLFEFSNYTSEYSFSVNGDTSVSGTPGTFPNVNPSYTLTLATNAEILDGYVLDGTIADVILYNRVLSTNEKADVLSYLSTKHSVPLVSDTLTGVELETWDNLAVWLEPTDVSYLTMSTQPTPTDYDMEDAGTSAWSALQGAVLTKETTNPHSGLQSLRIAYGGISYPYTVEGGLINGNRYIISLWAHGDGTYGVRLQPSGAASVDSTASTDWQELTYEGTTATSFNMYSLATSSGYGEIDDLTVENISIAAITPRAGSISTSFTQATAANQPWKNSTSSWTEFAATLDCIKSTESASGWNFLNSGDGGTLVIVFQVDTFNVYNGLWGTASGTSGTDIGAMSFIYNNEIYYRVQDGVGGLINVNTSGLGLTIDTKYIAVYRLSNIYDVRLNGTSILSGAAAGTSASTTFPLNLGSWANTGSYQLNGTMADVIAFDRYVSNSEIERIEQYLANKHSISI